VELPNFKKWIKPAIVALPSKRTLLILFTLLLTFAAVGHPLLNRWIYPLAYEDYILDSAEDMDVDPYLIMAIIRVETKFELDQESRVGAQGLMQLMPETVDEIVRKGKFSPTFRDYVHDPAINIRMGSWYIAALMREFKGNKIAVMAAYNAGPGNVHKWMNTNVWDGKKETIHKIPYGETRHYIQRVSWYYDKYRQVYGDLWRDRGK
jgi:soluble lytic murein transglycosylase